MSNIYDLHKQEDELNREYWHFLEDLQADIVCEDDYIILEFKQRNQRLYFPNRETLEKVLNLTRKTDMEPYLKPFLNPNQLKKWE